MEASKLQTVGGWQSVLGKHHYMLILFIVFMDICHCPVPHTGH